VLRSSVHRKETRRQKPLTADGAYFERHLEGNAAGVWHRRTHACIHDIVHFSASYPEAATMDAGIIVEGRELEAKWGVNSFDTQFSSERNKPSAPQARDDRRTAARARIWTTAGERVSLLKSRLLCYTRSSPKFRTRFANPASTESVCPKAPRTCGYDELETSPNAHLTAP